MSEGALDDPQRPALAIKQAAGDVIEAVFLLRAYRTTLPRFGYTQPVDTARMRLSRRISSTFKDVPGGQILGPTYDYTQRLLDFSLEAEGAAAEPLPPAAEPLPASMPRVTDLLQHDRSEEHTSELQSLMRISYAVFCLKKKKQKNTQTHQRVLTNHICLARAH